MNYHIDVVGVEKIIVVHVEVIDIVGSFTVCSIRAYSGTVPG